MEELLVPILGLGIYFLFMHIFWTKLSGFVFDKLVPFIACIPYLIFHPWEIIESFKTIFLDD